MREEIVTRIEGVEGRQETKCRLHSTRYYIRRIYEFSGPLFLKVHPVPRLCNIFVAAVDGGGVALVLLSLYVCTFSAAYCGFFFFDFFLYALQEYVFTFK